MSPPTKSIFTRIPISELVTSLGIVALLAFSSRIQGARLGGVLVMASLLSAVLVYVFDHSMDRLDTESDRRGVAWLGWSALFIPWAVLLWKLDPIRQGILALAVLIGHLYHPRVLGLKKVPYLKSPLVTAVIVFPATFLPEPSPDAVEISRGFLLFAMFILVFSNALLFDELDRERDRKNGLKTFPQLWTRRELQIFLGILLGTMLLLLLVRPRPWGDCVAVGLVWQLGGVLLIGKSWPKSRFVWILDGGLVIPLLIHLLLF